jgi:acyl carrier protein
MNKTVPGEQEVFERLRPLIQEVTGVRPDSIRLESVLVHDLGAESIDLLDLSFLIEQEFGITIEANEFEKEARQRIPGGVYERDGFLTAEALEELRRSIPEVEPAKFAPGLRKVDVPALLTVSVFIHLIQRKLGQRSGGQSDAQG